jgi:hypothetical protein
MVTTTRSGRVITSWRVSTIDKRKTNVKTELMIGWGGGMKMFSYIEGGYENFSIGFWEGMKICT